MRLRSTMASPHEEDCIKRERMEWLEEVKEELVDESRDIVFENGSAKCGEVMIGLEGEFTFVCVVCTQHFIDLYSFGRHVTELHLEQNALSTATIEKDNSCDLPYAERSSSSVSSDHESKLHSPQPMPSTGSNLIRKKLQITSLDTVTSSDFNLKKGSRHGLSSCEGSNPHTTLSTSGETRSNSSISTPPETRSHSSHPVPSTASTPIRKEIEIVFLNTVASSNCNTKEPSREELSSYEENNPATTFSDSGKVGNYVCTICGSNYLARSSYLRHMKKKHAERVAEQKTCKYCFKEFENLKKLATHICPRKGKRRYVCLYCPKLFHSRESRRNHINIHTIERPFKCDHCPKMFGDLKYLEKHKRDYHLSQMSTSDVSQNVLQTISSEKDDPLGAPGSIVSVSPQQDGKSESQCLEPTSVLNTNQIELETAVEDNVASSDNDNEASRNDVSICEANSPVAIFLNSTKTEEFVCTFCGCSYNARSSLVRHIKRKHPEHVPVQKICKYCDRKFEDSEQLKAHLRTHTGFKRYVCPFCPKLFDSRSSRQDHISVHTEERPFKCTLCRQAFKQQSNLEKHTRKRHQKIDDNASSKVDVSISKESTPIATFLNCAKVGEFGCGYCGRSYKSKVTFRKHMKRFHPNIKKEDWVCIENEGDIWEESNPGASNSDPLKEGAFVCKICGISYHARTSYNRHLRTKHPAGKEGTEQGPGQFVCKFCYEEFTDMLQYTTHVRAHTERKRYKCPFCPKVFEGSQGRKSHITTHTGERPYKCPLCPKAFAHPTNLESHKRAHLKIKKYECNYCDKRFVQPVEKKMHERTHTGEKPYQCEECGDRFKCHSLLVEHRNKHKNIKSFVCKICGKAFISSRRLSGHMSVHNTERNYHCDVCGKSFASKKSLRAHLQIHSAEKKYVCNICGAAFAQCAGLYSHRKSHGHMIQSDNC